MKKKIIYLILGVIVIIFIGSLMFTSINLNYYSYKALNIQEKIFDNLFTKEIENKLNFNHAIGNANEQIYFYSYKNEYDLIVYDISIYTKIKRCC